MRRKFVDKILFVFSNEGSDEFMPFNPLMHNVQNAARFLKCV